MIFHWFLFFNFTIKSKMPQGAPQASLGGIVWRDVAAVISRFGSELGEAQSWAGTKKLVDYGL